MNLKTDNSSFAISTILAIGGLDPSGGAGILVDAAAARFAGCHAAAVCAVMTVQNGQVFLGAQAQDPDATVAAADAVGRVQQFKAIKTGALGSAAMVEAVANWCKKGPPLVVDPVLRSSTGGDLAHADAVAAYRELLIPVCSLVTPNLAEAEALSGLPVDSLDDMVRAGNVILELGAAAVLVKGGHLAGDQVVDVLVGRNGGVRRFSSPRLPGGEVRGTGCALASLAASHIALGESVENAVGLARESLLGAIERARPVGEGPRVLQF